MWVMTLPISLHLYLVLGIRTSQNYRATSQPVPWDGKPGYFGSDPWAHGDELQPKIGSFGKVEINDDQPFCDTKV
jgi:hypothetical protein